MVAGENKRADSDVRRSFRSRLQARDLGSGSKAGRRGEFSEESSSETPERRSGTERRIL